MAKPKKKSAMAERVAHLAHEVGGVAPLARLAGLGRTMVQSYVTQGAEPSARAIAALCRATGCSREWLQDGIGDPPQVSLDRVSQAQAARRPNVADMPPTGLPRLRGAAHASLAATETVRGVLDGVAERTREALDAPDADQAVLRACIPAHLLAALRAGMVVPGTTLVGAVSAATGKPVRWLLTGLSEE